MTRLLQLFTVSSTGVACPILGGVLQSGERKYNNKYHTQISHTNITQKDHASARLNGILCDYEKVRRERWRGRLTGQQEKI